MNVKHIYAILILLLIPIRSASSTGEAVKREVIRSLTNAEMAIPAGRHTNFSIKSSCRVQYPAPRVKPVIEWKKEFEFWGFIELVVDSKGQTWHSFGDCSFCSHSVVCLDKDGNQTWEKKLEAQITSPAIVCEGAVIVFGNGTFMDPNNSIFLECIDLKGNMLWRTVPAKANIMMPGVWRLSNDRLMLTVGNDHSGNFNIYSLKNGELLDSIKFPNWDTGILEIEALEMPDGGWIGYKKDTIVCYSSDMISQWEHVIKSSRDLPMNLVSQPMLTQDGNLILGTMDNLVSIDGKTGEVIWERAGNYDVCGMTHEGNSMLSVYETSTASLEDLKKLDNIDQVAKALERVEKFLIIDQKGNEVWSIQGNDRYTNTGMDTIEYQDGAILLGTREHLLLVDKDGSIIWSIDIDEFGVTEKSFGTKWALNPAPDGRIIATISGCDDFHGPYIFSLTQPVS